MNKITNDQQENNKIFSRLRKKYVENTKEEKVRQDFVNYLLDVLEIEEKFLDEEVSIDAGTTSVRADLVISKNEKIKFNCIVEFKEPEENLYEARRQAISYAKLKDIKYVAIIKGPKLDVDQIFYKKIKNNTENQWSETINFFNVAEESDILVKPFDKKTLINNLSNLSDMLRDKYGLIPFEAFKEINKIIFCKIYAEKKYKEKLYGGTLTNEFLVSDYSFKNEQGISALFKELKNYYKKENIFDENDRIDLPIEATRDILLELNAQNFYRTEEDIKGIVYEHFISSEMRGQMGQYFTPRIIIDFILNYLNLNKEDKICDPACGTGGFLISHFKKMRKNLNEEEITKVINDKIFGFDFNSTLVQSAKMNMILHGDGHVNIHKENSLLLKEKEVYDYILTNPPFGSDNVEKRIAKGFPKLKEMGINTKKTEILFLEKIWDLLKNEGKAAIILPLGILNNKNDLKIRKFLLKYFQIELIFRIPKNLFFYANTPIKTCIMILKKKKIPKIEKYNTKMFYIDDKNLIDKEDFINETIKKFKYLEKNQYFSDICPDISENESYILDPAYYLAKSKQDGDYKISDFLEEYNERTTEELIKQNNYLTIKSIDSNGAINLHEKINKTKTHKLVKKNSFFYCRLSIWKSSVIFWKENPFVVTGEYPTFILKKDNKIINDPRIIELLFKFEYFKKQFYFLATGQGRTRLQSEDFLNIKIPKKLIDKVVKDSKKYLEYLNKIEDLSKKIEFEQNKILKNSN